MRRISELTISGYRSVSPEQPCTFRFGDIALLIGPNGAGKSNVVSVFRMVQSGLGPKTIDMLEKGGAQSQFYLGPKNTDRAHFSVKLDGEGADELDWSIGFSAPNSITLASRETDIGGDDLESLVRVYQFNDTTLFSGARLPAYAGNDGMLMSDARNVAPFIRRMKARFPKYYSRMVEYVRLAVPGFDDFRLSEDAKTHDVMLDWAGTDGSGYVFGPHQLSDGSLRFICLAALLLAPAEMSPDVIVVDEPELGLHPAAINALSAMMKHSAEHSQVIVATQSPLLIDEFSADEIRVVERDGGDGHTVCRTFAEEELAYWLGEYTLSDLWQKNIIGGNP
jgi:predicted ATPase